jgi:ribonuclease Z
MTIKITFLGTGDAIPTAKRNHTSILLNYEGENILVDCGEGTQRQFRKANLNPMKITRILITHWHGDHVLGIPGLLQTISFEGNEKTINIYGPKGTKKYMKELLKTFVFSGKLNLKIHDIEKGKFIDEKDFFVEAEKMNHGCPCLAYTFVKKGKLRIDKKKLGKYKIKEGKHLSDLKKGKDIIYNGKKYKVKDLTYMADEKKISFVFDTLINEKIVPFVKNSDLLICESSYGNELLEKVKEHHHLTAKQNAENAKKSKSKKLVLTHISRRYEKNFNKILNESKKIFKNSYIARDLESFEVK